MTAECRRYLFGNNCRDTGIGERILIITRPQNAAELSVLSEAPLPCWAIPKIDGFRCIKHQGKAKTKKFKLWRNFHIQNLISKCPLPEGVDGELTIPGAPFHEMQSQLSAINTYPRIHYSLFDIAMDGPYETRLKALTDAVTGRKFAFSVEILQVVWVDSVKKLAELEKEWSEKYEGIMIRKPGMAYKCGRWTLKQGGLLKFKRFADSEAEVIGFEEQQENTNLLSTDEAGYAKRSHAQAGMVGKNTLGKFVVRNAAGVTFEVGTGVGLTDVLRKEIWDNRDDYLGRMITYKSQKCGEKDKPRFPIWKGFRDEDQ